MLSLLLLLYRNHGRFGSSSKYASCDSYRPESRCGHSIGQVARCPEKIWQIFTTMFGSEFTCDSCSFYYKYMQKNPPVRQIRITMAIYKLQQLVYQQSAGIFPLQFENTMLYFQQPCSSPTSHRWIFTIPVNSRSQQILRYELNGAFYSAITIRGKYVRNHKISNATTINP